MKTEPMSSKTKKWDKHPSEFLRELFEAAFSAFKLCFVASFFLAFYLSGFVILYLGIAALID
jgi:hypothetical protein